MKEVNDGTRFLLLVRSTKKNLYLKDDEVEDAPKEVGVKTTLRKHIKIESLFLPHIFTTHVFTTHISTRK